MADGSVDPDSGLNKGTYFCDDGGTTGTAGNKIKDGDEAMVTPFGTKSVAGWPKPNCSAVVPMTQNKVDFATGPHDYGTTAAFLASVDNSVAGQMRDCAECHVGGGMMEYIPVAGSTDLSVGVCETRTEYYGTDPLLPSECNGGFNAGATCTSDADCINGIDDGVCENVYDSNGGVACSAADQGTDICGTYPYKYGTKHFQCIPTNTRQDLRTATLTGVNTFNYYIEQYDDVSGDGDTNDVVAQDYSVTGVLEMDCLMCHLEGYSWEARKDAIRAGNFDSSRSAGSGIGTVLTGTTVAYDAVAVGVNSSDQLTLGSTGLNVHGHTPSENCASCHMDLHQVDWKKRGDSWGSYADDVHAAIGCLGCHGPSDQWAAQGSDAGHGWRDYMESLDMTGKGGSNILGHDPAKGNAPFSSLWNATDNTMKTCANCHIDQVAGNYGAADPTARHTELGLNATLMQNGRDGVQDASHIDMLDCAVCHARKKVDTGGAMVDSTGADAEGRNTDHENSFVTRNMANNLAYAWQGNKLTARNVLMTMFWRDKEDTVIDINADGQTGAMDAVNPSHVREAMRQYSLGSLDALTQDGTVTDAEINTQRAALTEYLPNVGITLDGTEKLKLSFMGVAFKVNHNISPAIEALGVNGCTDCHGAGTVYSGNLNLKGNGLSIAYTAGGVQVVPFTKVNGPQFSDFHPTTFAKGLKGRSIAIQVASGANTTLRDMDRSELLYENDPSADSGPGPRTMVDSTVANSRAEVVAFLDGIATHYNAGMHSIHNSILGNNACTNCHTSMVDFTMADGATGTAVWDGTSYDWTYTWIMNPAGCSKWAWSNLDGITGTADDYVCVTPTPETPTGFGTCATACHGKTDGSEAPSAVLPSVVVNGGSVADYDTDLVVNYRAKGTCDGGLSACTYSWSLDALSNGTILSSSTTGDTLVVQYTAAEGGTTVSDVSVTVTSATCAASNSAGTFDQVCTSAATTIDGEPVDTPVDPADSTATFTLTPGAGNTLVITQDVVDSAVDLVYVSWGDRTRDVYDTGDPEDGVVDVPMTHTYGRSGNKTVKIMVVTGATASPARVKTNLSDVVVTIAP